MLCCFILVFITLVNLQAHAKKDFRPVVDETETSIARLEKVLANKKATGVSKVKTPILGDVNTGFFVLTYYYDDTKCSGPFHSYGQGLGLCENQGTYNIMTTATLPVDNNINIIFTYYNDTVCKSQVDQYILSFPTGCASSTATDGYVIALSANPPTKLYSSGYWVSKYYGSSTTCSGTTGKISQDATQLGVCQYAFGNAWFDQTITGQTGSDLAFSSIYYKAKLGSTSCVASGAVFFFTDVFSTTCTSSAIDSSIYSMSATIPTFNVDNSRREDDYVDHTSSVCTSLPQSVHWVSPSVCNYNVDDGTSYTVTCNSNTLFQYAYYSDYQCQTYVRSVNQGGAVCGVAFSDISTYCVFNNAPTYAPTRPPTLAPTVTTNTAFSVTQTLTGITLTQFNADLRLNSLTLQQAVATAVGGGVTANYVTINTVGSSSSSSSLSAEEGAVVSSLSESPQGVVVTYTIATNSASSVDTVNLMSSNLLTNVGIGLFQTSLWTNGVNNNVMTLAMSVPLQPMASNPYTPAAAASSSSDSAGLSSGGVAGVVITVLLVVGGAGFVYYYYYYQKGDASSSAAPTSTFSWSAPNFANSGHNGQELMSKSSLKTSLIEENSISAL